MHKTFKYAFLALLGNAFLAAGPGKHDHTQKEIIPIHQVVIPFLNFAPDEHYAKIFIKQEILLIHHMLHHATPRSVFAEIDSRMRYPFIEKAHAVLIDHYRNYVMKNSCSTVSKLTNSEG